MSANPSNLVEGLFDPSTAKEFLNGYWPDKTFSYHGSPDRLPAYLRGELLSSFDKLATHYHGRVVFGNASATDRTVQAKDVSIGLLRKMGLSLYLLDLESSIPGTNKFLREVEQAFGAKTGVARIGAFAAAVHNGVTPHFDSEEVISVQLEGTKRFYIAPMNEIPYPYGKQYGPGYHAYDDLYPQMGAGIPKLNNDEFECVEMRPGSVLFMPRGTWHRTEAAQESLSVSIIVRQPAAFENMLEHLKYALLRDPRWRQPLYISDPDDERLTAHIADLIQELPDVCRTLSVENVLDRSLSEQDRAANMNETSWLQRVPHVKLLLNPHPQRNDIWTGSVKVNRHGSDVEVVPLQIPIDVLPIFQWLQEEERPIRAGDITKRFPTMSFADIKIILEGLTRASYLKLLLRAPL